MACAWPESWESGCHLQHRSHTQDLCPLPVINNSSHYESCQSCLKCDLMNTNTHLHKLPPQQRWLHQGPLRSKGSGLLSPTSCRRRSKCCNKWRKWSNICKWCSKWSNRVSGERADSSRGRKPRWGKTRLELRPGPSRSFRQVLYLWECIPVQPNNPYCDLRSLVWGWLILAFWTRFSWLVLIRRCCCLRCSYLLQCWH